MAGNRFESRNSEDFKILDAEGKAVGEIRVKPSGVLWRPRGKHSWHGVSLEQFAEFAIANGKKQER